jgi:hypothetical protein
MIREQEHARKLAKIDRLVVPRLYHPFPDSSWVGEPTV